MTEFEQLEHERHIAEVLAIRGGRKAPAIVQAVLNSTVVATLVGVLGTGLLGAWVSDRIQQRSQTNELERSEWQQRLSDQTDAITKALRLVGSSISTTDDLLMTINTAYDEKGRTLGEANALRAWKAEVARARDKADLEWRLEKRSLGYTIQYLFKGDPALGRGWKGLTEKADLFEQCTRTLYGQKASTGTPLSPDTICQEERASLIESIEQLLTQVARHQT
jgi:hypothetical protein